MFTTSSRLVAAILALAAPTLAFAEPVASTGVAIANGSAILAHAGALRECVLIEAGGMPVDTPIVFDDRNGLALLTVSERRGEPTLAFSRQPPELSERVLIVGYSVDDGTLDGSLGSVADRALAQDPTRFAVNLQRRIEVASPVIINTQGHLVGFMDALQSAGPGDVASTHSAIAALIAETARVATRTGRRNDPNMNANQAFNAVRDAMVQILCYDEQDLAPTGPDTAEVAFITDLVDNRLEDWSSPNAIALDTVGTDYASRVDYYGTVIRRAEVVADKRRFAERWPLRLYTLRQGSLIIDCDRAVCNVSGLNDYFAVQGTGGRQSTGVSEFLLSIDRDTGLIVSEDGRVVERGAPDTAGALRMWRQRARACRRNPSSCARLDYTEEVMAEIGLCPDNAAGNRNPVHCEPISTPDPSPLPGASLEATSVGEFSRGQTEVIIADFGPTRMPSRGELVVSVQGQINNLDPGTLGNAVIILRVGTAEITIGSLALPANFQTTNVSQTLRLDMRDMPDTGPGRRPDTSVFFRTGARSFHTRHNTLVRLDFR
jgi:hypothetical protein